MTFAAITPGGVTDHCPVSADGRCDLAPLGTFPDPTGKVGPLSVERCRRCGLGVTRPPLADVAFLYEDRDSRDFQPDTMGLSRLLKRIAFRAQARRILRQVGRSPARVIDFGCGSGLFTACLAEVLPDGATVIGTDFHPQPPAGLEGVVYRPLSQLADIAGYADLLIASHVLEHDDDPLRLLAAMVSAVRPGGRLVIEVPNLDCVWIPLFGRNWDGWYLPYHRVHFSRASLRALIERAGLRVVGEHDVCVPSLGRSSAQVLGRPNGTAFVLLTAALYPLQVLVERLSGRPSALRFIVEKPDASEAADA